MIIAITPPIVLQKIIGMNISIKLPGFSTLSSKPNLFHIGLKGSCKIPEIGLNISLIMFNSAYALIRATNVSKDVKKNIMTNPIKKLRIISIGYSSRSITSLYFFSFLVYVYPASNR